MATATPPAETMGKHQMLIHTLNAAVTTARDHVLKSQALFILHQLVKANFRGNRVGKATGVEALQLDANTIYKLFEENCASSEPRVLVSVIASGLLAEMLAFDEKTSKFIVSKFTGTGGASALTKLVSLIDINSGGNRNEMRYL
jgi:hypothetical protein